MSFLLLKNQYLEVAIDQNRGADFLDLIDKKTKVNILFSTPYRAQAQKICSGTQEPLHTDSRSRWLEHYRGGWQILCPNAGQEREVFGTQVGFHGEVSIAPWQILKSGSTSCSLRIELNSIPLVITRTVSLNDQLIAIVDELHNISDRLLEFDYVHHPAFGSELLDGDCRINTGATTFTMDWNSPDPRFLAGSIHGWPMAHDRYGNPVDLSQIQNSDNSSTLFGWLENFNSYWISITNVAKNIGVRIEWDGAYLPYAWLWQDLNATSGWPFYKEARVIAIEPASTQTSGKYRKSALRLNPSEKIKIALSLSVHHPAAINH
jgi:hypothetical protein